MNQLKVFENKEFGKVRTVVTNGEPWFVGKDVADALGYAETNNMMKRLDDEDFMSSKLEGMNMKSILINESGLYSAIIGSKLPTAKKFKHWVTAEVLPSIRKHGAYLTPQKIEEALLNPDTLIQLATNLKNEQLRNRALEGKIEQDKPKVIFADAVTTSKTAILIGELAKLLKQNNIEIGQNRLFEWLRNNGYLIKRKGTDWNAPTQRSMELGLFEVKETVISHADGHTSVNKTTKVTGNGQVYFINMFFAQKDVS